MEQPDNVFCIMTVVYKIRITQNKKKSGYTTKIIGRRVTIFMIFCVLMR